MNIETLIGMRYLFENEQIDWKIKPKDQGCLNVLARWIRNYLKGVKK